jgi:hypothetical protein
MAQALWQLRAELGRGPFGDHTSYAMASDLRVCDLARRLRTKTLLSWVRSSVLRSRGDRCPCWSRFPSRHWVSARVSVGSLLKR